MIRMERSQQLIDKPRVEKFNYPGLTDRSNPLVPVIEPVNDAVVKKKEKKEYVPTGGKKLKLTKPKNF